MWETDTTRMDKQQLSTFFRNYVDSGSRRDAFLFSFGYHETSTRISFHKRRTSIYKRTSRFDACSESISKIHERHENRRQVEFLRRDSAAGVSDWVGEVADRRIGQFGGNCEVQLIWY